MVHGGFSLDNRDPFNGKKGGGGVDEPITASSRKLQTRNPAPELRDEICELATLEPSMEHASQLACSSNSSKNIF